MPTEPPSAFVTRLLSDSRHSRTARRPTIAPLWSPSDSALSDNSQSFASTRLISSKILSPSFSSRRSWVLAIALATWLLWRCNPAGDIETRFAMFRNGSPVARALSIPSRSGLEQARHVLGIGQTSILALLLSVKVRRTRSYSVRTCGFQIRCFVFSATLSAYPAASAAFLSLWPLSFPNKNNRCLSVRPFLSSDLRRSSCSSRVGGFGSSKSSGLKSCEIRCLIAALSETISLLGRPIDLPHATPRRLLEKHLSTVSSDLRPTFGFSRLFRC